MADDRVYNAIILNEPYAGWVKTGKKTIETRMRRLSQLSGDVIICCDKGKSADSKNAGKAICLVYVKFYRVMVESDVEEACIENAVGRWAYPLTNLRHFSYDFNFTEYAVTKNWQGVFKVRIPDFVQIIKL
jgi:hypothetical protein